MTEATCSVNAVDSFLPRSYGVSMRLPLTKIAAATAPLIVWPVFTWLIVSGQLSLGGGEKDIVFSLFWFVFAVIYGVIFLTQWRKDITVRKTVFKSILGSVIVSAAFIFLFAFGIDFLRSRR